MAGVASYEIGSRFERIVADIFRSYNFCVALTPPCRDSGYDILATSNDISYLVEVKYLRANYFPTSIMFDTACRLKIIAEAFKYPAVPVLVIGAKLKTNLRMKIENVNDILVLDIQNLLFLVQGNEMLKSELLSILDFSVNDILPDKPKTKIFDQPPQNPLPNKPQGELLKERISKLPHSHLHPHPNEDKEYEDLCFDVLKYLFDNELSLWHRQQKSNADLYRFDLICKIKDGDVSGLWSTILQCFNSKYIIFEFKNYSGQITQKEIYSTDKYLYLKALRGVAILVSCKGTSPNADKAIRGTLRENGKLILSISNTDLLKMIEMKMNEEVPADYLYSKFDELLIDLEK